MAQRERRWLAHLGAGLILALLLCDVLSPSVANASCGDYVHPSRPGAVKHDPLPRHDMPGGPCTGPTCSRPEQAPLAPVVTERIAPEAWAALGVTSDTTPDRQGWLRPGETRSPVRHATSIYHPPR